LDEVKILGLTYAIERVPVVSRDDKLWGRIDYEDLTIKIDANMSEKRQAHTIAHEAIHGILGALGFREENENETLVQSLSTALCQCVTDNPGLFMIS